MKLQVVTRDKQRRWNLSSLEFLCSAESSSQLALEAAEFPKQSATLEAACWKEPFVMLLRICKAMKEFPPLKGKNVERKSSLRVWSNCCLKLSSFWFFIWSKKTLLENLPKTWKQINLFQCWITDSISWQTFCKFLTVSTNIERKINPRSDKQSSFY